MKIEQIILREIRMSLNSPFETSFGVIQDRRIVLVEVVSDGISGWGEVTTGEAPSYNSETTETAWHVISDFIAPLVVDKLLQSATEVAPLLSGIRGHEMAKAGVENAIWDIEAQQKKMALAQLLGGTRKEIRCGVSLGIRENPLALVRAVEKELRCGYQRIKLKIKPGKDMEFAATVRKEFPDIQLYFYGTVGSKAKAELYDIRFLSVGKVAPNVEGIDQDGRTFKLSDYRGKVVLLDFWSEF